MTALRVTDSIEAAADSRSVAILQTMLGTVGAQSKTAAPQSEFKIGKNNAFPAGTVQLRVTGSPPLVPAKKNTGPNCCSAQFAPVVSAIGLLAAGIDNTHCHHWALHSA